MKMQWNSEDGITLLTTRLRETDTVYEHCPFGEDRKWNVETVVYEDGAIVAYQLRVPGQWHTEWYDRKEMDHLLSAGKFEKLEHPLDSSSTTNDSIGFDPGGTSGGAASPAIAQNAQVNVNDQTIDVHDVSITHDTSTVRKKMQYSERF